MAELLPCPICGNIVHITESTVRHYGNRADYEAKIECSCGLTFEKEWIVQFTPTNESVLISGVDIETAWNTRTPPTTDDAEVVRCKDCTNWTSCHTCEEFTTERLPTGGRKTFITAPDFFCGYGKRKTSCD